MSSYGSSGQALTVADLTIPATDVEIAAGVSQVCLSMGVLLELDRMKAMICALQAAGYTRGQIATAANALCLDVELDQKLRYGHTLTAADFVRVLTTGVDNGKLYTYSEAMEAHRKASGGGECPGITFDQMFEPVPIDGHTKPMWRRIG